MDSLELMWAVVPGCQASQSELDSILNLLNNPSLSLLLSKQPWPGRDHPLDPESRTWQGEVGRAEEGVWGPRVPALGFPASGLPWPMVLVSGFSVL